MDTYICDLLHYLSTYAMANGLSVEHTLNSPIFMYSTPLPYSRIEVQHPLEEHHGILFGRLYKLSLSSPRRARCLDVQLAMRPLPCLTQISLLLCPFFHHSPDILFCRVGVLLLYRAFLDKSFPTLSVMLSGVLYHPSPSATSDTHYFFG